MGDLASCVRGGMHPGTSVHAGRLYVVFVSMWMPTSTVAEFAGVPCAAAIVVAVVVIIVVRLTWQHLWSYISTSFHLSPSDLYSLDYVEMQPSPRDRKILELKSSRSMATLCQRAVAATA